MDRREEMEKIIESTYNNGYANGMQKAWEMAKLIALVVLPSCGSALVKAMTLCPSSGRERVTLVRMVLYASFTVQGVSSFNML